MGKGSVNVIKIGPSFLTTPPAISPTMSPTVIAKGDSAASHHYWKQDDCHVLQDVTNLPGPSVHQPDSTALPSVGTGQLPLSSKISPAGKHALILPALKSASLISLGQLCDDGCTVVLNKNSLTAIKDDKILVQGVRNSQDGLWDIPLQPKASTQPPRSPVSAHPENTVNHVHNYAPAPPFPVGTTAPHATNTNHTRPPSSIGLPGHKADTLGTPVSTCLVKQPSLPLGSVPKHTMQVIIRKNQPAQQLARYLHACCFSPVKSTWLKAIQKGHFHSWPGLTTKLVRRHLPLSTATVQGHIHRERQNLQSTKPTTTPTSRPPTTPENSASLATTTPTTEDLEDSFPTSPVPNKRTKQSILILMHGRHLTTAYQDLTGRFPLRSSRGNEYILVGYHQDANYIHGLPVKNRTAKVLTAAWQEMHDLFSKSGHPPELWILDNECSGDLKAAFQQENLQFQQVPPHSHKRNQAERAIQTFKNHLKAGFATMDPEYPLSEWDRILPQCNITLNLLRTSRANPNLSAYSYIHGIFNFAATPLAPPGTKVVAHLDPSQRGTHDLNGELGWYIGPALSHYRCVECYFPKTRATRICDTVTFFPQHVPFPTVTTQDYLKQAAEDIIHILLHPPKSNFPSLRPEIL